MKNYTSAKEFRNTITIESLSNCCGAVVYPDSDICSDCKEHCGIEETCDECYGKGTIDVLDDSKSMEMRIDPPLKTITCEKCNGEGYIEVDE
jgi:DnaJ-class molecular chaperone